MTHRFTKLAAFGCLAAGVAFAQTVGASGAARRPAAQGALRQRIMKNLDLSTGQKAQAKTIFEQAKAAAVPVRTQLQEARQALQAAVKANSNQIPALSAKTGEIQGQLLTIRNQAIAQIYALLTPDQKTKLDQIQEKLQRRLQQRRPAGQAAGN